MMTVLPMELLREITQYVSGVGSYHLCNTIGKNVKEFSYVHCELCKRVGTFTLMDIDDWGYVSCHRDLTFGGHCTRGWPGSTFCNARRG